MIVLPKCALEKSSFRFGAHYHLPVRSAVTPLLKMLRVYEKLGYLTLQVVIVN